VTRFQSLRQLSHLSLEFQVRGLREGEVTLQFLRLLGKLFVNLLLFRDPLYGNLPKHRVLEGIILVKACKL
jgi:hypothetical protein